MAPKTFTKTFATSTELVALLKDRGLEITNEHKAEHYLENIGYYRLSAYMYPLLKRPKQLHLYKKGASFEKVMELYRFDKKLRMLMLNEIEKIEVSVREAVMNITAQISGDDFWLMNDVHFANKRTFEETNNIIKKEYQKSREDFILHFKKEYLDPYPPAWILGELLTMGTVNIIYRNLKDDKTRKAISKKYGLQPKVFESWLTTLTLVRNACCHHARVWNKVNFILPMIPKRVSGAWIKLSADPRKAYFNLCIIKNFLHNISPDNDMYIKLKALFSSFPGIDSMAMGFPKGWEMENLWR